MSRFAVLGILCTLQGCVTSPPKIVYVTSPLVVAACPPLSAEAPDTFGDTVTLLIKTDGQYLACREAALGTESPK